jgi:hypothetical protein
VTRSIVDGATVAAVSRSIEAPIAPFIALPGVIPVAVPKT